MNKVYRSIYNKSLGAWIAVSELTKGHAKSSAHGASIATLATVLLAGASGAQAACPADTGGLFQVSTGETCAAATTSYSAAISSNSILRAGGAGIPAFFTKTGVGTLVAEGKELREFDGETYVMEHAIVADVSLVKAWRADKSGNLQFRLTARNFNPAAATCGKVCVVEVEELVEVGEIAPDDIHLPGIYVHRIVHNANPEKRIEKRTVREA
mgnify:CR=1 FL=1